MKSEMLKVEIGSGEWRVKSEKWRVKSGACLLMCLYAYGLVGLLRRGGGVGCGEKRGDTIPPPPPNTQGDDRQQEDMGVIWSWRMLAAEDSEIR